MKRILSIISLAVYLLFLFTGCSGEVINEENIYNEDKINIIATTFPQYDFVKQIVGDKANVTLLLSPGLETHSFEPSPKDRIDIANCDLFIYTGGEAWVDQVLETTSTENIKLISLMETVSLLEEEVVEGMSHDHEHHDHDDEHHDHEHHDEEHGHEEHGEKEHGHEEHGHEGHHSEEHGKEHGDEEHHDEEHDHHDDEDVEYDEHVWTSPKNAIEIVEHLSAELVKLDEANKDYYESNTQSYLEDLAKLDQLFIDITQSAKSNTIVVADRFPFRYLTDAYGLKYYAAFAGCSTQTDASPATLAFLIDIVEENNIPVVFYTE